MKLIKSSHLWSICISIAVLAISNVDSSWMDAIDSGKIDFSAYLREVFDNIKYEQGHKLDPTIVPKGINEIINEKNLKMELVVDPGYKIEGISTVQLNDLSFQLNPSQLAVNISFYFYVPHLKASGKYKMDGKAFRYFPVRGDGNIQLAINDLEGRIAVNARHDGHQLRTKSINLEFRNSKVTPYLENLIDKNLSGFMNGILKFVAKPLIDKFFFDNNNQISRIRDQLKLVLDKQFLKLNALILEKMGDLK